MTTSLPNRAIAAGLALAVALWLGGAAILVAPAQAVTIEELQAQIADLTAQLAALSGGSTGGSCYTFTRDLFDGVGTGADVTALQDYLTGTGHFTFSGGSTGYFGPITSAAVAAWQAANGVAPAVGYFGPISRTMYNSVCTPGDGGGTTVSGDLEGGEGSISVKVGASPANSTQVEYDTKTKVMRVKIEALEGSDVEVGRLDFHFEDRIWLLVDAISIEVDGDEVFSDDGLTASDFTEVTSGSDYRLRVLEKFTVREGDISEVDMYLTGKSLLSAANLAKTPEIWLKTGSVRFTDANGLSQTDGGSTDVASTSSVSRELAFSSDTDATVEAYENGGDNPQEGVIVTESATTKQKQTVLAFKYEVENSSIELNDVDVDVTSVTANLDDILSLVELYLDSDKDGTADDDELVDSFSSFAAATTDSAEFDDGGSNLSLNLDTGVHQFLVTADFKKNDGTNYNDDEEIGFDLDVNETSQNQTSDFAAVTIAPATDVLGPQLHLYNAAPMISNVAITNFVVQENNADIANATLEFDITASGGTIYFNGDDETTATALGVIGDDDGSFTVATESFGMTGYTTVTNSGADNEYWTLNNGATGHVTVTITNDNATSEQVGWLPSSLEWGDTLTTQTTRAEFSIDWVELIDEMTIQKVYLKT